MGAVFVKKTPPGEKKNNSITVVVPKKAVKKASKRNLIKRRIRSIMKPHTKEGDGFCYVVITKNGVGELSFSELKEEIEKQL